MAIDHQLLIAASSAREEVDELHAKLISVDYSLDSMCFYLIRPSKATSRISLEALDINTPFPAPLKLHSSVYDLLDGSFPDGNKDEFDLRIIFQIDAVHSVLSSWNSSGDKTLRNDSDRVGFNDPSTFAYFETVFQKLRSYRNSPFETFFWTDPSNLDYFIRLGGSDRDILGHEEDRMRYLQWTEAAERFKSYGVEEHDRDACKFDEIISSSKVEKVSLKDYFPIANI